ncbi:MAG: deoxyribodipyrimidine photo-lyase, partial [Zoogloea sp.]|nr:deoxyribodipyrimidine photo-lyase [Zoogloea sp.]
RPARQPAGLGAAAVYANRDYEPAARERDAEVKGRLAAQGIAFHDFKDQVIFDGDEVQTRAGGRFSVFTPYKRAWLEALTPFHARAYPVARYADRLAPPPSGEALPTLAALGFAETCAESPLPAGMSGGRALFGHFLGRIADYKAARDFPARQGVSGLSVHLRFGTVSIRELVGTALAHGGEGADCWLSELIWRDFYQYILAHNPHVVERSFRPEYDRIRWDDSAELFEAWCAGRTGYPLVDAAMRQLNRTGCMHNRLRMVVASFLTKDFGIDWRRGERYFAERLNDYDLAANNGGWQWAASTGCDAQPWFRIFNPVLQSQKFDPDGAFIRCWLPELAKVPARWIHAPWTMPAMEQEFAGVRIGRDYPAPRVDHAVARERTLARFGVLKAG